MGKFRPSIWISPSSTSHSLQCGLFSSALRLFSQAYKLTSLPSNLAEWIFKKRALVEKGTHSSTPEPKVGNEYDAIDENGHFPIKEREGPAAEQCMNDQTLDFNIMHVSH